MTLGYQHKNLKRFETYGARAGFSKEFDYTSFSAGLNYTKEWNEGNTELNLNAQAFIDRWKIIYPELWLPSVWNDNYLTNPNRNSFNAQVFFSQIISPRLILGLSAEMIYMTGLLSTPFHSVYFSDQPDWMLDIERLPSSRLKIPLGIRLNYFPLDFLVLRTNYRFYTDDFGIKAHSIEIEAPLKLSGSFTVSPFYRYHTQTASKYFAPKFMHLSTEEYYTSDYDLSALHSHKIGLGIKYYPLMGILRSKPVFSYAGIDQYTGYKGLFMLKYIELRSAYYTRSTDLNAFNISINLGFSIK